MSYPQLTRQYMAVTIATFANLDRKYYWPKKQYLDEMIKINPLVQRYSHFDYETLDRLRWVLMIQRSRTYNAGIDGPYQQAFLQLHATLELEVVESDHQADMLFDLMVPLEVRGRAKFKDHIREAWKSVRTFFTDPGPEEE